MRRLCAGSCAFPRMKKSVENYFLYGNYNDCFDGNFNLFVLKYQKYRTCVTVWRLNNEEKKKQTTTHLPYLVSKVECIKCHQYRSKTLQRTPPTHKRTDFKFYTGTEYINSVSTIHHNRILFHVISSIFREAGDETIIVR